jgi:hypothetical protein
VLALQSEAGVVGRELPLGDGGRGAVPDHDRLGLREVDIGQVLLPLREIRPISPRRASTFRKHGTHFQ